MCKALCEGNCMKSNIKGSEWDVHLSVEVDDIDSFENLRFIADEYVAFSYSIDEYISKYKSSFRLGSFYCNVNIVTPQGPVSERDIFLKFSKNKELSSKAVNFIENIIRWSKDNGAHIWREEVFQFAQDAAFSLCVASSKYIPLYTDLLLQSDLDHESHQYEQIDEII